MVSAVEGFSEVKIDSINLHSLIKLFAYVVQDLKLLGRGGFALQNPELQLVKPGSDMVDNSVVNAAFENF